MTKFEDETESTNYTLMVVCNWPIANPTWLTVVILKISVMS